MDNRKIFDNYLTNHYSNCEKTDFSDENQVVTLLKKNKIPLEYNLGRLFKTKISKERAILDLGCGYGSFLFFLQAHGYKNVTGVDISTEEIVVCKKLFRSYKFVQADIYKYLLSEKEKFDVIYLSHVLEHIKKENLFGFLEEVRNRLVDGGTIIIVVPNCAAYFNSTAGRYGDITHEIGFTNLSLRQVLVVAGFKRVEMKNFYGVGNFWLNILRKITLFFFKIFIQILGYDKQDIYTSSLLAVAKK